MAPLFSISGEIMTEIKDRFTFYGPVDEEDEYCEYDDGNCGGSFWDTEPFVITISKMPMMSMPVAR